MKPGTVYLVGAGSDAGMITREGLRLIRRADCIVYDDLLDSAVLAEADESCERIAVGKRYKAHKKEQEEIHRILIDEARQGKMVVRLKGGDPTVFGRGRRRGSIARSFRGSAPASPRLRIWGYRSPTEGWHPHLQW